MRTCLTLATACGLILLAACPAFAADEGGGLGLEQQLDGYTILTSIVVFVLLLIVLSKTAWKPILAGLQQREQTIQKALDDAHAAHEQAKALIAEYEGRIDKAREEAQAIFEEARRDADQIRAQIEAEAQLRSEQTVERARREIEQLGDKAWERLVVDAANLATQAAGKIIERELSPQGHAQLVADVVGEYATRRARQAPGPQGPGRGN